MKVNSRPLPAEMTDPKAIIKEIGRYGVSYREIGAAVGCSKSSIGNLIGGDRMLRSWGDGDLVRKLRDLLTNVRATRAIIEHKEEELMMIREPVSGRAMKHFELESDPFEIDEGDGELWLDDERERAIKDIEKTGAKHGFLALIGPCGAGKSVVLNEALKRVEAHGDVDVIRLDPNLNQELTFWQVCERILMHFQEATWLSRNGKVDRVKAVLMERMDAGGRTLLVIEEAQMLRPDVLRGFKRLWEWADAKRRRLIGIVLVGQPGLAGQPMGLRNLLMQDMRLREIALRINLVEFRPLDARLEEYLRFRIRNVKDGTTRLFAAAAIEEMKTRLNGASHPLVINVLAAKCLNMAAREGKKLVDAEVVKNVR